MHFANVTKKQYRPPLPHAPDDDAVRFYRQRDEDFKDHSMLQWMREVAIFRVRGDTVDTVRRREGVVATAVDCVSVSKSEHFYQSLLMNLVQAIPQSLTHECAFSIPSDYRWLATALYLAPSRMQGDKEEIVQTRVLALAARGSTSMIFSQVVQCAESFPLFDRCALRPWTLSSSVCGRDLREPRTNVMHCSVKMRL